MVVTAPPCKKYLVKETDNQNQIEHQDNNDLSTVKENGQMTAQSTTRPSLLHPKQSCYIRAWNVWTMNETGKAARIEREMNKYNIQILGISESRWTGNVNN